MLCLIFLIIERGNVSAWIPAYNKKKLLNPADLTRGTLHIYSLVPQKANRVGVGFQYNLYSGTKKMEGNILWHQYPGNKFCEISKCDKRHGKVSELNLTQISAFWELRVKDQMFQIFRNNEIMDSFPVIDCLAVDETIENVTKMEVTLFLKYAWSNSPYFYRYQLFSGKYYGIDFTYYILKNENFTNLIKPTRAEEGYHSVFESYSINCFNNTLYQFQAKLCNE